MRAPEPDRAEKDSSPLFTPLGVYHASPTDPIYYLETSGRVIGRRPSGMCGIAFLLQVKDDPEHWRRQFPRAGVARGIDTAAALAWFLQLISGAGEYLPPEDIRPRSTGRPVGARDGYQRVRSKPA